MNVKSEIKLPYKDEYIAKYIHKSLQIDDGIFVKSFVRNNTIHATIESSSLQSFHHTIDDYLSCITIAENILESNKKKNK